MSKEWLAIEAHNGTFHNQMVGSAFEWWVAEYLRLSEVYEMSVDNYDYKERQQCPICHHSTFNGDYNHTFFLCSGAITCTGSMSPY